MGAASPRVVARVRVDEHRLERSGLRGERLVRVRIRSRVRVLSGLGLSPGSGPGWGCTGQARVGLRVSALKEAMWSSSLHEEQ